MKALIYKDLIVLWKYCKSFLIMCIAFLAASALTMDLGYFSFYALMFIGILPTTLLNYEEREKWEQYALVLPYSRRQIVTEKYLLGLVLEGAALLLNALAAWVRMERDGSFDMDVYLSVLAISMGPAMMAPTFMLPAVFRLGSEKGRLAYAVTIAVIMCFSSFWGAYFQKFGVGIFDNGLVLLAVVIVASAVLYPLSWRLAVKWYEKRQF